MPVDFEHMLMGRSKGSFQDRVHRVDIVALARRGREDRKPAFRNLRLRGEVLRKKSQDGCGREDEQRFFHGVLPSRSGYRCGSCSEITSTIRTAFRHVSE